MQIAERQKSQNFEEDQLLSIFRALPIMYREELLEMGKAYIAHYTASSRNNTNNIVSIQNGRRQENQRNPVRE